MSGDTIDRLSRREFLQRGTVAGIAVYIALPGSPALAALFENERLRPSPWDAATGKVRYRTDATAKVTGEKIFSIDMRARDLPGWPQQQTHAMLLRVIRADHAYAGFDLAVLGDGLMPDRTVTAADLERDGVAFPPFYGEAMLLPVGGTPAYLGQAVAILVWQDFARFRAAKTRLKFREDLIRWGGETGPREREPWASFRYVRFRRGDGIRRRPLLEPQGHAALPRPLPQAAAAVAAARNDGCDRRARHGVRRGDGGRARRAGRGPLRAGARVFLAVDRHRGLRGRQRQRLARRGERHAALRHRHAIATGDRPGRREAARREPVRRPPPGAASLLHRGLRLQGSQGLASRGWTAATLRDYLGTGLAIHAAASGEMLTVVQLSTSRLSAPDLAAMTTYLLGDEPPVATAAEYSSADAAGAEPGHREYLALCAGCHGRDGEGVPHVAVTLRDNSSVRDPNPRNLIVVILAGLPEHDFVGLDRMQDMPGFAQDLSDADAAALSNWLRHRYGGQPEPVTAETVGRLRALARL